LGGKGKVLQREQSNFRIETFLVSYLYTDLYWFKTRSCTVSFVDYVFKPSHLKNINKDRSVGTWHGQTIKMGIRELKISNRRS
jgi:hypothetical protein